MIEKIDLWVGMAIAGLFTGIGSTLGAWLANKAFIKHIDKLEKKLEKKE